MGGSASPDAGASPPTRRRSAATLPLNGGGNDTASLRSTQVCSMRVFVYEHFTATGFGREPGSPQHAIYREGRAMRDALTADFAQLAGVKVLTFPDDAGRCSPADILLLATGCDWTIVIAPELDGILTERVAGPARERLPCTRTVDSSHRAGLRQARARGALALARCPDSGHDWARTDRVRGVPGRVEAARRRRLDGDVSAQLRARCGESEVTVRHRGAHGRDDPSGIVSRGRPRASRSCAARPGMYR